MVMDSKLRSFQVENLAKYNKFRGIPGFSNNMLTDLTNDVLSVKSKLTNYLNIKLGKYKSSKKP